MGIPNIPRVQVYNQSIPYVPAWQINQPYVPNFYPVTNHLGFPIAVSYTHLTLPTNREV